MTHPMKTGRYYYFANRKDMDRLIEDAARAYHEVTGHRPDRAHVSPILLDKETHIRVDNYLVHVVPDPVIAQHIVWMGESS